MSGNSITKINISISSFVFPELLPCLFLQCSIGLTFGYRC
nr:MAG TPA: hypothetical protein [Bacteriophage sp.]